MTFSWLQLQPLVVAIAVAVALGMLTVLAVRVLLLSSRVRGGPSALHATLGLAPLIVPALSLVALLTPNPLAAACHCAPHGDHHPHLCWIHPDYAAPLLTPALLLVAAWLLSRAPALVRTLAAIVRSSRLARKTRAAPEQQIDGVCVRVLDCSQPTAFTAGLWSPSIVIDRTLAEQLADASLRAVIHHEHAHVIRRDGLTLALLRLVAALFGARLLGGVVSQWTTSSEEECDRHAADRVGSASDVAAALVLVERLGAGKHAIEALLTPAISSADLARRVQTLLGGAARPASLASDAISIAIVATGLLLLSALWPGDAIHHLTETLLGRALVP